MLVKYFLFSTVLLLLVIILNNVFSPLSINLENKEAKYSDWFKKMYTEFIWAKTYDSKNYEYKFKIIESVLKYNVDFKKAHDELCQNINSYLVSSIKTISIINVLENSYKNYKTQDYASCLVKAYLTLEKFEEAIKFLKKEEQEAKNPYDKNFYFEKIKETINNRNIIVLSKALENYYYDKKNYPGDISVLKELAYIDKIPEDPYGGQYYLAEKGLIRSTSARK